MAKTNNKNSAAIPAPLVPSSVIKKESETLNIPLFKDQKFKNAEEKRKWILEQSKKFGYVNYINAQTKGLI